ncbi:AraC family transcriptional regulator [Paenibacillus hamazuiensis]|uniref:AraC family transcriptional regulator n=1 Tax=Paenibacillus hamazuiensis TaxID=2936508 RepID=UPI00200C896A|nr:AraC family transcriptional regulator [Paenibacillus hamazuiensis]
MKHEVIPQQKPFLIEHVKRTASFSMSKDHSHDSYEIYYMSSGERFYFIKDRTYHVRQGDLVLIEPLVLHRTTEAYSPNHERVLINFKKTFVGGILVDMDFDPLGMFGAFPLLRLDGKEQTQVSHMLDKMLRENKLAAPESHGLLKVQLAELLVFIHRCTKSAAAKQPEFPNTLHQKVSDIVKYINEHYAEPLSLRDLADRFHMSPFYLSRIYKEVTGFTFVEYVNQVRIKEAQKLLRTTSLNITAITEKVGYESSTHFGRVFKAITGIAPLQYRKLNL